LKGTALKDIKSFALMLLRHKTILIMLNVILFINLTLSSMYMNCVCCGGEMLVEKETERIVTLKCKVCGLGNTMLKD
jgi:hypothetical protein